MLIGLRCEIATYRIFSSAGGWAFILSRHFPAVVSMGLADVLAADLLLINGKIVTVDAVDSIVEAVAVKDGKILTTGSNNDVKKLAGEKTKVIDLKGKTVLPGIIDSHTHPHNAAMNFLEINCRGKEIRGIKDIKAAVAKKARELGPGKWIRGSGYNDSKLAEKRQITRRELDEAAPDNPVYIVSDTGHQAIVNSKALAISGITKGTPDPDGGQIHRDESGAETGLLYETATKLVADKIPEYTVEQVKEGLRQLWGQFSEWGITSTHDASAQMLGIRGYQELLAEGVRKVRVNLMVSIRPWRAGEEDMLYSLASLGIESGFGDDWLKVMSLKIMGDGSGAGGTAGVYTPQHRGPKGLGLMLTDSKDIERIVMKAHEAGLRVSIHSIGDKGVDIALDCIEKAQNAKPVEDMRHRLEHNSCCTPKQLKRIKRLGVVPSSSIGYMYGLGDQYAENFGPERVRWLHPHKTMKEMGIVAGGNSDCPVTFYGPFVQMYAAVTRKSSSGQVVGPEEAISVMDAIRVYTLNGAYLAKEENTKGSIEPGKLADMIVLDRDVLTIPPDEIKDVQVLTTIVDGVVVYKR
ncbi:MAG: amidohydrolase [bacterium]|nr:amidohydrolase [bacterium]